MCTPQAFSCTFKRWKWDIVGPQRTRIRMPKTKATLHLSGTTESLTFCCCEHLNAPPNPPLLSPFSLSISCVYSLCIYSNMAVCPEFRSALVPPTVLASSLIFCDQNVQVASPRLLNMTEFCFFISFAPCYFSFSLVLQAAMTTMYYEISGSDSSWEVHGVLASLLKRCKD